MQPSRSGDAEAAVLIAGAGPTGLALALELRRLGARPRLVDAAEEPSRHSKALAVHARTLERLEPSGVTPRLIEAGLPIRAAELHGHTRRLLRVPFDGIPSYYPFVLSLPQAETERILGERLAQLGGAVERGCTVTDVKPEGGALQVGLARAGASRGDAAPGSAVARWVVGCDGIHSRVREALGLAFRGEALPEQFALADVALDWQRPHDVFRAFLAAEGALAVIPLPAPGAVRAIAVRRPDAEDDGAPADGARWEQRFRRRTGEKVRVREVLWSSSFRVQRRRVARLGRGAVLLAGDAAHVHSPVGGQGMNLGIHDALELARLLCEADGPGTPEALLARYEGLRLPAIDTVLRETTAATRMITLRNPLACTLRDAALRLLGGLPSLRTRAQRNIGMKQRVHAPHGDPDAVA